MTSTNRTLTKRSSPCNCCAEPSARRDLPANVPPEELLDANVLSETGEHPVEPGLQQAEIAEVVDLEEDLQVAVFHTSHARPDGIERAGDRARPRGWW